MKKVFSIITLAIVLGVFAVSSLQAQIVEEGSGSDVTCNCAFWGGNNDCRADNGGRTCKTTSEGDENCRENDSNCGDTPQ